MIHLTASTPIQIATEACDFRKGIDGFVALCQYGLQQNPRSGTLYVFINRRATMIRILAYETNGYWLMTKRLSEGKFRGWPRQQSNLSQLAAHQLRQLLAGVLESNDDYVCRDHRRRDRCTHDGFRSRLLGCAKPPCPSRLC